MGTGPDGSLILSIIGWIATSVVTIIGATWGAAWKISGMKSTIDTTITDLGADLRRERTELADTTSRNTGEGLAALRQKATDMELWSRDNFVRRSDFQNVVDGFTKSIESLRIDINANYQRLDDKLNQLLTNKNRDDKPR